MNLALRAPAKHPLKAVAGHRLPDVPALLSHAWLKSRLRLGAVEVVVTGQTVPCRRMDEAHPGLLKALFPAWRGGLTTRVVTGGLIGVGDTVNIVSAPPDERAPRLPG